MDEPAWPSRTRVSTSARSPSSPSSTSMRPGRPGSWAGRRPARALAALHSLHEPPRRAGRLRGGARAPAEEVNTRRSSGLFRDRILTQDATYLCNKLDLKVVPQASYPFFHIQMEDVWVWDKNRPTRIIPRARGLHVRRRDGRGAARRGRPAGSDRRGVGGEHRLLPARPTTSQKGCCRLTRVFTSGSLRN